jgi:predicted MFS family arabinose efflux permease
MIMGLTDSDTRPRAFSWNVGLLVGTGGLWILISGSVPGWLEAMLGVTPLVAIRIALLVGAVATLGALILFVTLPRGGGSVDSSAAVSGEQRAAAVSAPPVPATVVILVVLVAGWMLGPALVTPFFNLFFNRELGVPVAQIGLIFAVAHLITAFAIFGSGELAARLGPKRALAGWMLLFGPTMLAMAVVGSLGLAIVFYLVQGFVSPATNPLIDQILLELAPAGRRGMVSSMRNAATEGSGAGGAALAGVVLESGSFATLFAAAGITGLIAAVLLLFGLSLAPASRAVAE